MITSLIIGGTKETQEETMRKILAPFAIHPADQTVITSETSIGIEQIRDLKKQLALKPGAGTHKSVVFPEAETLTAESQQALLKTLEEPPHNTILILVAQSEESLLPTILSRCQIIRIKNEKVVLSEEKEEKLKLFWETILKTHPVARLTLIPEIGKGKEVYKDYLNEHIIFWKKHLSTPARTILAEPNKIVHILKSALTTLGYIESNVNPRLSLDHFFLSI